MKPIELKPIIAIGFAALLSATTAKGQIEYIDSIEVAEAGMGVERVAVNFLQPYYSVPAKDGEERWVQIDLGQSVNIEGIKILPPSQGWGPAAIGFPALFNIKVSDDPEFKTYVMYEDRSTGYDVPDPGLEYNTFTYSGARVKARYVRFTATKFRLNRFCLTKIMVFSGGKDVAEGCPVAESERTNAVTDALTRPARPDGEFVVTDNPQNVIPQAQWHPVKTIAEVPQKGVKLNGGLLGKVFNNNVDYLLNSFTYEENVRNFKLKAGLPVQPFSARFTAPGDFMWLQQLPGSCVGRFLMGAGNSLRWTDNAALRSEMDAMVNLIDSCKEPDGYLLAFPKHMFFQGERGAYCRSWVTQGLIEAGYAGNKKAFTLLGNFSKWLNQCQFLPEMLKRCNQGTQGMIPITRTYFTPVGKPEDIYTAQRYFQLNHWMESLTAHELEAIYKFPYNRPHNYLVTTLEAYMDLYLATGDKKYLDAVNGGYDLFHDNWEHIGGSLAINEGDFLYYPKTYWLTRYTGELCGNSFWIRLNQRYHKIYPQEEKYVAEIEKSFYNVVIPNQVGDTTIRYFARLTGHKDGVTPYAQNTCCEGQGTRAYATLPEHIWSVGKGNVWVNLYAPSSITCKPGNGSMSLEMNANYPYSTNVKITVKKTTEAAATTLNVRIPYWATGDVSVKVNGKQFASGKPGTFLALKRQWKNGDKVSFDIPAGFTTTKYEGSEEAFKDNCYAIQYAGLMLSAVNLKEEKFEIPATPQEIASKLEPIKGKPLHFMVKGNADIEVMPYLEVENQAFTCFPKFTGK